MKESKAISLGFSRQELITTIEYKLVQNDLTFRYYKCKFSGKNVGYWLDKGDQMNSIPNKETFEYLLGINDPWEFSCKIKD